MGIHGYKIDGKSLRQLKPANSPGISVVHPGSPAKAPQVLGPSQSEAHPSLLKPLPAILTAMITQLIFHRGASQQSSSIQP